MRKITLIGLGAAALLAVPALAQEGGPQAKPVLHHHHHPVRHYGRPSYEAPTARYQAQAAPAAPGVPAFFPHIAPYPDGQGDTDGLSRDPNDCNKGCIGEP